MNDYFWIFPLIFIFHDMEEVIGLRLWIEKNKSLIAERFPRILKTYQDFSTEGFAAAVYEELILCILISLFCVITQNSIIHDIWLGAFIGCTIHFAIHILQTCILRMYIPATITSIICLPVSVFIILKCLGQIGNLSVATACWIIAGMIVTGINLIFAQKLIGCFTRLASKGEKNKKA